MSNVIVKRDAFLHLRPDIRQLREQAELIIDQAIDELKAAKDDMRGVVLDEHGQPDFVLFWTSLRSARSHLDMLEEVVP